METYDHYMRVEGSGRTGPGSKPNVFNPEQRAGDYLAAGVGAIGLHVRYLGQGPEVMALRIGLQSPDGFCWSLLSQTVVPGTPEPWAYVVFPIRPVDLGGADPAAVLANVTKLRLYHAPIGTTTANAPALDVRIGYDNIRALASPSIPGDANIDGFVNDDDLSLLLSNWAGAPTTVVVPEPFVATLLALGALALLRRRPHLPR